MAGDRYKRIIEAARYHAAFTNFIEYMTDADKRGTGVGNGKPRPKSKTLYVLPFGLSLASGQLAKVTSAETTWDKYGSKINQHVTATEPTETGKIVKLDNYKPARFNIKTGMNDKGSPKTSKVTKMKYLNYGVTSTSLVFGDKMSDPGKTSEKAVFDDKYNSLKAEADKETGRSAVSWIREKV